jgi:hypothetical protein
MSFVSMNKFLMKQQSNFFMIPNEIYLQDSSDWPVIDPLPSYGRGRELPGKRHQSLIFGSNLTDVIITGKYLCRSHPLDLANLLHLLVRDMEYIVFFSGANGTIDGQGTIWWYWFHNHTLNYTRPPLVELMYSTRIVISNLTFTNSPFWNIHPVYCRFFSNTLFIIKVSLIGIVDLSFEVFFQINSQVLVQHLTILAPISSPNTDGIDPGVVDFWKFQFLMEPLILFSIHSCLCPFVIQLAVGSY